MSVKYLGEDQIVLTDQWNIAVTQTDELIKNTQDHAYELGLKRGRIEGKEKAAVVADEWYEKYIEIDGPLLTVGATIRGGGIMADEKDFESYWTSLVLKGLIYRGKVNAKDSARETFLAGQRSVPCQTCEIVAEFVEENDELRAELSKESACRQRVENTLRHADAGVCNLAMNLDSIESQLKENHDRAEEIIKAREEQIKRLQNEIQQLSDDYCDGTASFVEEIEQLKARLLVLAEGMLKAHKDVNCGGNKAMDYIRHGAVVKVCPVCQLAGSIAEPVA